MAMKRVAINGLGREGALFSGNMLKEHLMKLILLPPMI